MPRAGLLSGKVYQKDYDVSAIVQSLLKGVSGTYKGHVIRGMTVTYSALTATVAPGQMIMAVNRTGTSNDIFAHIEILTNETITVASTCKVWMTIGQTAIDNGLLHNTDGTGIATLATGASYPVSGYYVPLATITSGVVTSDAPTFQLPDSSFKISNKSIKELLDVQDGSPSNGNYIRYNSVSGLFEFTNLQAVDFPTVRGLFDDSYYFGEAVTIGQPVFIEPQTTFALSTTVQNIGDVVGNTRVAIPIFGTGVNFTTLKIALKKFVSPGVDLGIRIETNSAGSPSNTIVTNGSTTVLASGLTTSLADTTVTFGGTVNLTAGTMYWLVLFAGTYGTETINATNFFGIGYNASIHTTTRGLKVRNATVYSAGPTFMTYVTSTGILDNVLSLTDADYSYKTDLRGYAQATVTAGGSALTQIDGIETNQSSLTVTNPPTLYYLGNTPGTISSTPGTITVGAGIAISATRLQISQSLKDILNTKIVAVTSSNPKILSNTVRTTVATVDTLIKSIKSPYTGVINISFEIKTSGATATGTIYRNGVAYPGATISTSSTTYVAQTYDVVVTEGDEVQLYIKSNSGSFTTSIQNYQMRFDLKRGEIGQVILD